MNSLSNAPGVSKCRKVDHFRFLVYLKAGPPSVRTAWQTELVDKAELLMHGIRIARHHRRTGNKDQKRMQNELHRKGLTATMIDYAVSIARCGTVAECGEALITELLYSNADQDALFDVRSWQRGSNLDDGIHAVKCIASAIGLDGSYCSHFCTVPRVSTTERRTLVGHFGGAVLVTATRHEFLTTHRLMEKLIADDRARRADLKAITDQIGTGLKSPADVRAGRY